MDSVELVKSSNHSQLKLLNLHSPAFLNNPYPCFKLVRRKDPVYFLEGVGWVLTRFEDCVRALCDPSLAQSADDPQPAEAPSDLANQPCFKLKQQTLMMLNPRRHTQLKALLLPLFAQTRIAKLTDEVRSLCALQCAAMLDTQSPVDVINSYAHRLSLNLIGGFLGVPDDDQDQISRWVKAWGAGAYYTPFDEQKIAAGNIAALNLEEYFSRHMSNARKNTLQGLYFLDDILESNRRLDQCLTEYQLFCCLVSLYYGAQDSQSLMFGNALFALHNCPDQLALVRSDPSVICAGKDELFRYDPAYQFTGRIAVDDLTIGGKLIKRGQLVLLSLASANRDPEQYPDPDRLNLLREKAGSSLTFGHGVHECLGIHVAHLSVPAMLTTLFEAVPRHRLAQGAVRNPSHVHRGFTVLPIEW